MSRKITRDKSHIQIPLTREPDSGEWKQLRQVAPEAKSVKVEAGFSENVTRPHSVLEALKDRVDPKLLPRIKHAFDIIGDVAVIEASQELSALKELIAKAIVEVHNGVKTVLCKSSAVGGEFRVRSYEHVLGERKTETIHKEHGCRYVLDVTKAYFSPRLATEHLRVASQVGGEIVVDMFSGIGPFSILIAKRTGSEVYSIDLNPYAIEYLKRNCELNKVERIVHPILGDARSAVSANLKGIADRVIMNHPSGSSGFVDVACLALKPAGGVVHFYQFQPEPSPLENAVESLRVGVETSGRKLSRVLFQGFVRSVAPREWQVVVDAVIK
jgi:tRNA (guanine37-N1)-methyltransferase